MSRWPSRRTGPDTPAQPVEGGSPVRIERDNLGIVSTGADATIIQQAIENSMMVPAESLTPVMDVPAPIGLCHLPMGDGLFLGRDDEIGQLNAAAADPLVVVQAVHGLGGIGKSTLVAHWAAGHRDRFAPTWWITADSAAGVEAGLIAFAGALQPGLSQVLPSEALRERALGWLASHSGWLLVLDNVTDPADLNGLFARVPPNQVGGRMVATSRRATGWPQLVTPVRLGVLPMDAAVELLTRLAAGGGVVVDQTAAEAVCAELGSLPLAVEQAGAYMAETGTNGRDYMRLLEAYPAEMFRDGGEGRDAQRTIARIWHVTLDALCRDGDDLPGRLLRVLAWYAPNDITRGLVEGIGDGEPATRRALGRLAAYNMITLDPEAGTIAVHRLVQTVARTADPDDVHRQAVDITAAHRTALQALASKLPDWKDPAGWPLWRRLSPHVDGVTRLPSDQVEDELAIAAAYLKNLQGSFLQGQGNVHAAVSVFEKVLTERRRVLGGDHPDTLVSLNNLAGAYESSGDLGRAVPLYEQVVTKRRRVLGGDHPNTLNSINNLAGAYESSGDPGRAIPLFEQVLTERRRVLGDDHPDTLASVNNLAYTYQTAGDLDRAIPLFERARIDCVRVLGGDHPNTLNSINNLAGAYYTAGDLDRAIPLFEQARIGCGRVFGENHPDTLNSINNLAGVYHAVGDLGRAIPLFEQALACRQRVLGYVHPNTLTSVNNLAYVYRAAGDPGRVVSLFEQTVSYCRRELGDAHPITRTNVKKLREAKANL